MAFVWGIHRDRWIPRTKGQLRGKCFHLMRSSWYRHRNVNHNHVSSVDLQPWKKIKRPLTHWGRVMHICIGSLTIIDSDNGLSPGQCQAIIWTNAGILLVGFLGTNFIEILNGTLSLVLPFYVHRAMPRSVYPCISSVIVLPLVLSIWMIFFIRPSLDGTYYGMALSVRPYVRPSVRPSDEKNIDANGGCFSNFVHRCA